MNSDDRRNQHEDDGEDVVEEGDVEETFVDDDDGEEAEEEEEMDEEMDEDRGEEEEDMDEDRREGEEEILLEDDSVQGFFAHKEPVFAVALHPQQQTLVASGGSDDRAYVWRLDTGEQLAALDKHGDSVSS
ncbi:60S ribosomal subunit assembly or modification protein, partial [Coemansia sp. RSA 2681]